jgi:hypothetical protein
VGVIEVEEEQMLGIVIDERVKANGGDVSLQVVDLEGIELVQTRVLLQQFPGQLCSLRFSSGPVMSGGKRGLVNIFTYFPTSRRGKVYRKMVSNLMSNLSGTNVYRIDVNF